MPATIQNERGKMVLEDEVFATIAGLATVENIGIVGMAAHSTSEGIWQLLGRENVRRGVRIQTDGDHVTVDLHVMMQYGVSIIAVAENVIHNVSYKLEETTGVRVSSVNVHVEGVRVQE